MLELIVIGVLLALLLWFLLFSFAPFLPTKKKDFERIHRLSDLKPGQTFYDLGCGDGRVCVYIAKNNPKATVIGVEYFFPIFLWAKIKQKFSGHSNMRITFGDVLKTDVSDADVLFTFALPKTINGILKKKFQSELKKGAKLISYVFIMNEWEGDYTHDKPRSDTMSIHVYQK